MDGFAFDPALLGVSGSSTSLTGRVRDVPRSDAVSVYNTAHASTSTAGLSSVAAFRAGLPEVDPNDADDNEYTSSDDEQEGDEEEDIEDEEEEESNDDDDADEYIQPDKGKGKQPAYTLPPLPPRDFGNAAGTSTEAEGVDDTAENAELGRLISAIRDNSGSVDPTSATNRGILGQEWDRTMQEEQNELEREDIERRNRTNKRPRGRVALADMEPSSEVKSLLGQANLAYVHGDTNEAVRILTEIIRIEPNTKPAWYTLSSIHEDLGNKDKAIQLRIVVTHLERSNSEQWKELGHQSREMGLSEQAIYCYGQAVRADRTDAEAQWERALLLRDTGKLRQAVNCLLSILKQDPHNPAILREIGPIYWQLQDTDSAIQLYVSALDYWRTKVPIPKTAAQIGGFSKDELSILSDLYRHQRRYRDAARIIVDGQRWLQGRIQEEPTWSLFGDDREFDAARKTRPQWESHPQRWVEEMPIHPLDDGLRLRLGLSRLWEGRLEEAKIHFAIVMSVDVTDNPEHYGEIADAYFDRKMWTEALEIYYDMSENEATNVPAVWIRIAQCQRRLGDLKSAAECYQAVVESDANDLDSKLALAEIYERLNERDKALMLVNEVLAQRREERNNGIDGTLDPSRATSPSFSSGEGSAYEDESGRERVRRRRRGGRSRRSEGGRQQLSAISRAETREERLKEEQRTQDAFDEALLKLQELDRLLDTSTTKEPLQNDETLLSEWTEVATFLIDTYRTTKALYPSDGKKQFTGIFKRRTRKKNDLDAQVNDIATRLQASMVDDDRPDDEPDINVAADTYRGVTFEDWAKLAVRLAHRLTLIDEREEGEEMLKHMCTSSMMRQNANRIQLLYFGLAGCAIQQDDYGAALDALRRVVINHRCETEPIRMIGALCRSGLRGLDATVDTKFQKYLLRQIKYMDEKALAPGSSTAGEEADSADEAEPGMANENANFVPTKVNPLFLMMYGNVMASGKSYSSAIVYYLRAYEMHPNDPLICLTLALAYAHRAMQRQADNRHYHVAQSVALLNAYRKLRDDDIEVNYNIARIFHQLGILDLAVKHYEKVLEMKDHTLQNPSMRKNDGELADLSKEAAFNLSSIYFTRNAPDLARAVVNKYLSM